MDERQSETIDIISLETRAVPSSSFGQSVTLTPLIIIGSFFVFVFLSVEHLACWVSFFFFFFSRLRLLNGYRLGQVRCARQMYGTQPSGVDSACT